ncbi:MAG TPA: hypothetical protein VLA74_12275 [Nitrososphaeraceae archaeon]|nr:hypothetical protein [Nitrososphaeraceae archaeon]
MVGVYEINLKTLIIFGDEKRSYVTVLKSIQKLIISDLQKRTVAFIIGETGIQIGIEHFWLWFCIEPVQPFMLVIYISEERNMTVAEKFIQSLVSKYGKHIVYSYRGTWHD